MYIYTYMYIYVHCTFIPDELREMSDDLKTQKRVDEQWSYLNNDLT